jgi:hypothetical protein
MAIRWKHYSAGDAYDELITPRGHARTVARGAVRYLGSLSDAELRERRDAPSGVSYMLENRLVMKRVFPERSSTTAFCLWTVTRAGCSTPWHRYRRARPDAGLGEGRRGDRQCPGRGGRG